ncbi:unnamed protein product [Notodromas monacha]|uniref:C-type lectin domain-containing protein n=1 Tax=Notodromas monacha TaxID=399045 RepID=A0A7R9BPW0_9CRUS|nr:unnamed protein product [Notodromas monacha]CAG0918626.1 unnamed protein product [Notodromas monacha]
MTDGQVLCKLPEKGDIYWTEKASAKLYYFQPAPEEIPTGFTQAEDGRYYRVVTPASRLNQQESITACQSLGGTTLALPYPKIRVEKLAKLMQAAGFTNAWTIGKGTATGTIIVDYSGELKLVPNASDPNQAWPPSIPNPAVTASDCITLNINTSTGVPFWSAMKCSSTLVSSYVCEASPPYFQIPSTKRWFRISLYPKVKPKGAMSAEWFCLRHGGSLASTQGPTENSSECALLDNVASSSSSAKQNTGSITGTLMMSSKYRLNGFEQQTQTGQFLTSVKDIIVTSAGDCALECGRTEECISFSVTPTESLQKKGLLCRIPDPYDTFWKENNETTLYFERPLPYPSDVHLATDGNFYKVTPASSNELLTPTEHRDKCNFFFGVIAPVYPRKMAAAVEAMFLKAYPASISSWWTSLAGLGYHEGKLLIPANSGELKLVPDASDPKQAWSTSSSIPNPVTASHCIALNTDTNTGAPFWNAVDCSSTLIKSYVCEASPPYFQIPSTKRWFRISLYPKVNPTGQMSAEWFCQRDGGTLAPTYGPTGLPTLTNALSLVLGTTSMSVHACGTRLSNGSWSMCGENVQPSLKGSQPDSQFWFTGEPGGTGSTNFLAVRYSADKATYLWDDVAMNQLGFICGLP